MFWEVQERERERKKKPSAPKRCCVQNNHRGKEERKRERERERYRQEGGREVTMYLHAQAVKRLMIF